MTQPSPNPLVFTPHSTTLIVGTVDSVPYYPTKLTLFRGAVRPYYWGLDYDSGRLLKKAPKQTNALACIVCLIIRSALPLYFLPPSERFYD